MCISKGVAPKRCLSSRHHAEIFSIITFTCTISQYKHPFQRSDMHHHHSFSFIKFEYKYCSKTHSQPWCLIVLCSFLILSSRYHEKSVFTCTQATWITPLRAEKAAFTPSRAINRLITHHARSLGGHKRWADVAVFMNHTYTAALSPFDGDTKAVLSCFEIR